MRKTISIIFGTRPEAIKLAPIILNLQRDRRVRCHVCVTAQHRHMLDQVLDVFDITPDMDLNLMRFNQTLAGFTARALTALDGYLAQHRPDLVLVQGDTTTVFCATLAAFYHHIPVGHVEAGLRTWDLQAPWPEEANRVLTSRLASLHFAPTKWSRDNLRAEGVFARHIMVTGNPVIDALLLALKKVRQHPPAIPGLPDLLQPAAASGIAAPALPRPRLVLITGHRRESFGHGFENICHAIARLARTFPDVHFIYPVHLNPSVREPVFRILGHATRQAAAGRRPVLHNVHLIEPLPYLPFVALMAKAHVILTDSGGIQEEAPSLGKPVLVMREVTERPEGVKAGVVRLVGTSTRKIVNGVARMLCEPSEYRRMTCSKNPYGDGRAAARIAKACVRFLTA